MDFDIVKIVTDKFVEIKGILKLMKMYFWLWLWCTQTIF